MCVSGISAAVLEVVLEFVYTDLLPQLPDAFLTEEGAEELFDAADRYLIFAMKVRRSFDSVKRPPLCTCPKCLVCAVLPSGCFGGLLVTLGTLSIVLREKREVAVLILLLAPVQRRVAERIIETWEKRMPRLEPLCRMLLVADRSALLQKCSKYSDHCIEPDTWLLPLEALLLSKWGALVQKIP